MRTTTSVDKARPVPCAGEVVRDLFAGATQMRRNVGMKRLRVCLPRAVRSDLWDMPRAERLRVEARAGIHPASLNSGGAVTLRLGAGQLGVKPGEFHFGCPYADGDTHLGQYGSDPERKCWTIVPRVPQRLWVRESFGHTTGNGSIRTVYRADGERPKELLTDRLIDGMRWTPATCMPRSASRILLEVATVRLERVQDITEEDARAERVLTDWIVESPTRTEAWCRRSAQIAERRGQPRPATATRVAAFSLLWDRINGAGSWDENPWCWVLGIRRVDGGVGGGGTEIR